MTEDNTAFDHTLPFRTRSGSIVTNVKDNAGIICGLVDGLYAHSWGLDGVSLSVAHFDLVNVPASPRMTEDKTAIGGGRWKCSGCGWCTSYARIWKSPQVRCEDCKYVSDLPEAIGGEESDAYDDCTLCHGTGEVLVSSDGTYENADTYGCPLCMSLEFKHERKTAKARVERLRAVLEDSQSLFATMLIEKRPKEEIKEQIIANRKALSEIQS